MCRVMEDMRNQMLKEGGINFAKRMLAGGSLSVSSTFGRSIEVVLAEQHILAK